MSRQLKLLLYLIGLVSLFLFLQEKFGDDKFFIKEKGEETQQLKESNETLGTSQEIKEISEDDSKYLEINTSTGESIRVNVEVADDDLEIMNGLSNRELLGDYDGMWFVFKKDVKNPFWMPNMKFPLDIIFVDSKGYIVDIIKQAQPCVSIENCPNLFPDSEYRYVLEVNGNFCSLNKIEEGSSIVQHI